MKNLGVMLILMMGLVSPLFGQLTIGVKLEQEQFLPGEDLRVAVIITNRSGRTLQFHQDASDSIGASRFSRCPAGC